MVGGTCSRKQSYKAIVLPPARHCWQVIAHELEGNSGTKRCSSMSCNTPYATSSKQCATSNKVGFVHVLQMLKVTMFDCIADPEHSQVLT